jgi:hypothetical protein
MTKMKAVRTVAAIRDIGDLVRARTSIGMRGFPRSCLNACHIITLGGTAKGAAYNLRCVRVDGRLRDLRTLPIF